MTELHYDPSIFDQPTLADAKYIVLSPEEGKSVDDRWYTETPHLTDLVMKHLGLTKESVLLDYGCGVGRMAKPLIDATQCRVIGVDISPNMRAFAAHYVNSQRFVACGFDALPLFGEGCCDGALAIWVLQHCPDVENDIERIKYCLKDGGKLFVLNDARFIPVQNRQFAPDAVNVTQLLVHHLEYMGAVELNLPRFAPFLINRINAGKVTCGVYRK